MNIKNLLLFILTFSFSTFAEKVDVEFKLQQSTQQVEILKAQLELMEKHNSDILSTVHWSLAGLLTLGIFIVGFSWFSNFRIYERDKESLKKELSSHVDLEFEKVKNTLELATNELKSGIKQRVSTAVSPKLDSLKDKIQKIEEDLKDELIDLQISNLTTARSNWSKSGVFRNAFVQSLAILELRLSKKYDWSIHEPLDFMLEDLNQMLAEKDVLDSEDIQDCMKALNNLNSEHEITKNAIQAAIAKMKKA